MVWFELFCGFIFVTLHKSTFDWILLFFPFLFLTIDILHLFEKFILQDIVSHSETLFIYIFYESWADYFSYFSLSCSMRLSFFIRSLFSYPLSILFILHLICFHLLLSFIDGWVVRRLADRSCYRTYQVIIAFWLLRFFIGLFVHGAL